MRIMMMRKEWRFLREKTAQEKGTENEDKDELMSEVVMDNSNSADEHSWSTHWSSGGGSP